jgi:putative heme-binding domain-containing protein
MLSRPEWIPALLDALEKRAVPVGDIPLARRNVLLRNANAKLRGRAVALFGRESSGTRRQVFEKYRPALALSANKDRGQAVYRRECKNCHRLGDEGNDVGPNLATIRHRAAEEVLLHILDPNREVSPNYLEYVVALKDGRVTRGVVVAETDAGLTLGRADGMRETILRQEIDTIAGTGQSLMPEGLERTITPQEMADLLAFLLR